MFLFNGKSFTISLEFTEIVSLRAAQREMKERNISENLAAKVSDQNKELVV